MKGVVRLDIGQEKREISRGIVHIYPPWTSGLGFHVMGEQQLNDDCGHL